LAMRWESCWGFACGGADWRTPGAERRGQHGSLSDVGAACGAHRCGTQLHFEYPAEGLSAGAAAEVLLFLMNEARVRGLSGVELKAQALQSSTAAKLDSSASRTT